MGNKLVNLASAERISGISRGRLERAIRDNRLESARLGGQIMVREDEAAALSLSAERSLGELCRAVAYVYREKLTGESVPAGVARDMAGMTLEGGGGLVPFQVAEQFWDRVRSFEPLPRVRWLMTEHREFEFPTVLESSRAAGKRWGGAVVRYGASQGSDLSGTAAHINQPQVGVIKFA